IKKLKEEIDEKLRVIDQELDNRAYLKHKHRVEDIIGLDGAGGSGGNDDNKGYSVQLTFKAATSGDPGPGALLYNNADPTLVTQINISDTDIDSVDIGFVHTLVSTLGGGGVFKIFSGD